MDWIGLGQQKWTHVKLQSPYRASHCGPIYCRLVYRVLYTRCARVSSLIPYWWPPTSNIESAIEME